MNIEINRESCTRCGKCVRVCPSDVLNSDNEGYAMVKNLEMCIVCGHCAAVCESNSVEHSEFPTSTIHAIDYSLYPTAEQLDLLLKARRSNRALTKKAVPQKLLDKIVEAAYRAPTASNAQGLGYAIITEPEKIMAIRNFTMDVFSGILKMVGNPFVRPIVKMISPDVLKYEKAFKRMQQEHAKEGGRDGILRGATAVILIYASAKSRFGAEDANLAYQNGSLMAEVLGVSQIYTGFVLNATRQKKGQLENILGIPKGCRIFAGMALGMAAFRYANYIDRKPINLQQS